jgi:hypothetical protein
MSAATDFVKYTMEKSESLGAEKIANDNDLTLFLM